MNIFFNKSRTLCTRNSVDTDISIVCWIVAMYLLENEKRKKEKEGKTKNICVRVNRFQDSFSHYISGCCCCCRRRRRPCLCVPVLFRSFAVRRCIYSNRMLMAPFQSLISFHSLWLFVRGHYYCYSRIAWVSPCACDSLLLAPEFNNIITSLIPSHSTTVPHASGIVSRRCLRTIFNFALNIYNVNRIKITFEPFGGFQNSARQTKCVEKKNRKKEKKENKMKRTHWRMKCELQTNNERSQRKKMLKRT